MSKLSVHIVWLLLGCFFSTRPAAAQTQASPASTPTPIATPNPVAHGAEKRSGATLDRATAEGLFQIAIELEKAGKINAACDKYEESNRLQQDISILVRLARCRKEQGKTATAWALFKAATQLAVVQGHTDLVEPLSKYSSELEAALSRLTLHVQRPVPELEIRRDGVVVGRAQFDEPLPIDPGDHTIAISAPGYEPSAVHVHIGTAENQRITLPVLQRLVPPPTPTRTRHQPHANANPWPWVLGGVGGTALLVGGAATVLAVVYQHEATQCAIQTGTCSDKTLWRMESRRDFATNVAWVSVPVGVATLGAATWLLLDGSKPKQPELGARRNTLQVSADIQGGQLWIQGRF